MEAHRDLVVAKIIGTAWSRRDDLDEDPSKGWTRAGAPVWWTAGCARCAFMPSRSTGPTPRSGRRAAPPPRLHPRESGRVIGGDWIVEAPAFALQWQRAGSVAQCEGPTQTFGKSLEHAPWVSISLCSPLVSRARLPARLPLPLWHTFLCISRPYRCSNTTDGASCEAACPSCALHARVPSATLPSANQT